MKKILVLIGLVLILSGITYGQENRQTFYVSGGVDAYSKKQLQTSGRAIIDWGNLKNVPDTILTMFDSTTMINVDAFGADGVGDDRDAIQNAVNAAVSANKKLYFAKPEYTMNTGIVISGSIDLIGQNTTIKTPITNGTLITAKGHLGAWYDISDTIIRGNNWFICPDLADSLNPGDLVKIYSDQPFCDSLYGYNEEVGRGEIKIVRNVVGDYIYTDSFYDNYYTGDWTNGAYPTAQESNLKAAKVYDIQFNMSGLQIVNTSTTFNTSNNDNKAIVLKYVSFSYIEATIKNFAQYGIRNEHVFGNVYRVNILNSVRNSSVTGDGAPGYGFELVGTSMHNLITGNIIGARHCFVYNAMEGVGWENVVSINAKNQRSTAMIDSHAPNGSIYIKNCVLNGSKRQYRVEKTLEGGFNPETASSTLFTTSYGIAIGSRYTYIENCIINDCNTAILFRGEHEVKELQLINNVFNNVDNGIIIPTIAASQTGSYFEKLICKSLYCNATGVILSIPALSTYKGSEIVLNDISGYGTLTINGNTYFKDLYIKNSNIDMNGSTINRNNLRALENVSIENSTFKNSGTYAFDFKTISTLINVNGCSFSDMLEVFRSTDAAGSDGDFVNYTTVCATIKFTNNNVRNITGASNRGIFNLPNYTKVTNSMFSNNYVENGVNYFIALGNYSAPITHYQGVNITHSAWVGDLLYPANTLTVLSGSVPGLGIMKGVGTPEGSVSAGIGAMYLRTDGSTTTTLYIKTSGTGNTGWTAK
jgi:hypothetical protein